MDDILYENPETAEDPYPPTRAATTVLATTYPPHPAEVKMPEYEALMTALAKFAKTSSCPAYLKTAYLRAQAQ